jgi:hypothetical protein
MGNVLFALHTALSDTEIRILERQIHRDEVQLFVSKPITEEKVATLLRELLTLRKNSRIPQGPKQRHAA